MTDYRREPPDMGITVGDTLHVADSYVSNIYSLRADKQYWAKVKRELAEWMKPAEKCRQPPEVKE